MSEIAALLLCKLGGKGGSVDEITAVLTAAGLEADADAVSRLVGDVEGKDINELLATGSAQIKDVPLGGGGGGGGGAAAGGAAAAEAATPDEPEEEEAEAPAVDMFGSGGGGGGGDY